MKTIRMSGEQMQKRIARFGALKPLPIQNPSIPERARDVVYSRKAAVSDRPGGCEHARSMWERPSSAPRA